jgi:transposase
VAQYLLQSLSAVKQWVRHYKDEGIDGLKEKQRSGRPSKARNQNHSLLFEVFYIALALLCLVLDV